MSGSVHEAEDLVQETFLRAWKGIGTFEGRSSMRAWLYRINSALQRARATLREHLPERRADWAPSTPTAQERAVLRRYMDAMESADPDAIAVLLAEDVRTAMPPWPMWLRGRETVVAALSASWDPAGLGYRFRMLATRANGQPAVATYIRSAEEPGHRAFAISVLRIEDGLVAEAIAFHETHLFAAFGLPLLLTDDASDAAPS